LPQCVDCGRELSPTANESSCESCRQRDFALHAEESAAVESQQHFLVSNLLFAINVLVFLLMLWKHVPLMSASTDQVIHWGGNSGPFTLGGQPWRLLTYQFVHIGFVHLAANMWALIVLGRLAESLYGRISFLAAYLIAGVAGGLASLLWNPYGTSAGASGSLFGIAGALISSLYFGKLPVPKRAVRPILISLVCWAAFDLAYGFWKPGVDNAAHVGGFIAGILVGIPLGRYLGTQPHARASRNRVFVAATLVLAALGFVTWKLDGYVVSVERARKLILANKTDEAIAILRPLSEHRYKNALLHGFLADAYLRKGDYSNVESQLKQILSTSPKDLGGLYSLAGVYRQQQRWLDAATMYAKAAELGRDNGESWFNAGLMYRQADRPQEALNAFQKAVAKNQFFFEGWFNVGISLMNVKQPANAVPALQKAVQLRPNDPEAHLWLGNAMMASGQEEPAKMEFLKAFQLRAMQQKALQQEQMRQRQIEQRAHQQNEQPKTGQPPAPTTSQPK
jgi:rhomboid protease GluP